MDENQKTGSEKTGFRDLLLRFCRAEVMDNLGDGKVHSPICYV